MRQHYTPEDDSENVTKLSKLLMILLLFCVLPSTSTCIFRTFHCRSFDDPVEPHLYADLSVQCYTPRHNSFMAYAALMIVVYPIGQSSKRKRERGASRRLSERPARCCARRCSRAVCLPLVQPSCDDRSEE